MGGGGGERGEKNKKRKPSEHRRVVYPSVLRRSAVLSCADGRHKNKSLHLLANEPFLGSVLQPSLSGRSNSLHSSRKRASLPPLYEVRWSNVCVKRFERQLL